MKYQYDLNYIENYISNNSTENRSNYSEDIYIVIIGHLNYINVLIKFYSGLKNIIFVVDDTENEDNVNQLLENNFIVLKNEVSKMSSNGFGNVNFQCSSSKIASEYLISKNVKYMIRMRSDQIILQLSKFINSFNFDKLGFFAYINNSSPDSRLIDGFSVVNNMLSEKYKINLEKSDLSLNYLMDYCISGPTKELSKLFSYYENSYIEAPAEHKLLLTYLGENNQNFENSFEYCNKNFYFMLDNFKKNEIDFIMLKQNYNNWTFCLTNDSPDLYLYK